MRNVAEMKEQRETEAGKMRVLHRKLRSSHPLIYVKLCNTYLKLTQLLEGES